MLVLSLPWFLLLALFVVVILLIFKKKMAALGVLFVVLGLNWWGRVVPLNFFNQEPKGGKQLKVQTWNIHGGDCDTLRYEKLATKIICEDADIVFLSEVFNESTQLMDSLLAEHYPYRTSFFEWCSHYFYSKYPIRESKQIQVTNGNEVIVFSQFDINGVFVDIFGCHLSSNNYSNSSVDLQAEDIKGVLSFARYLKNISEASKQRCLECKSILQNLDKETPTIILGDFNDISGSIALDVFHDADFFDAWWEVGMGYGATISFPLPYRIDHIFYNRKLDLCKIKKVDSENLSDHDALFGIFKFE